MYSFRLFFVLAFLLVSALSTYYISIMWLKFVNVKFINPTNLFDELERFVNKFVVFDMTNLYQIKFLQTATPVIVSSSPITTSISDIPFPATTVCNMNQAKRSIAKDIKPDSFEDLQLKTLCMRNDEINKTHNFTSSWALYRQFLLRVYVNLWPKNLNYFLLFRWHNHVKRCCLCVNLEISRSIAQECLTPFWQMTDWYIDK